MASETKEEVEAAIQAAEERVGDVAVAGDDIEDPKDQGGRGGHDYQIEPGSPQGQCCPGGPSSHGVPGGHEAQGMAGAHGNEGSPGVADNQGDPGARDRPGGPDARNEQAGHRGPGGPEVEERAGLAAVRAANVARAPRASGPGGDAAPEARGRGDQPIVFTITVPFGSHLEAEMARLAMDIEDPPHHQDIQKEFRVHGRSLAVRWTVEDPGPLPGSVNSFFQRLFLVIQNIQHSRPRFPLRFGRGAGP